MGIVCQYMAACKSANVSVYGGIVYGDVMYVWLCMGDERLVSIHSSALNAKVSFV